MGWWWWVRTSIRTSTKKTRGVGVCDFCDDYDYGIKQLAGNDDYDDDYNNNEGRYLFFRLFAQQAATSSKEEPPNTGGGRFFFPRCNLWSSGHC